MTLPFEEVKREPEPLSESQVWGAEPRETQKPCNDPYCPCGGACFHEDAPAQSSRETPCSPDANGWCWRHARALSLCAAPTTADGDALTVRCSDCQAPIGEECVTIFWRTRDGRPTPYCVKRAPHSRRRKKFLKFGPTCTGAAK